MNIEKADYALFSDSRPLSVLKAANPTDSGNDDDFDGGASPAIPIERPVEGMFNLNPLERYRYMFDQGQQVKFDNVVADPQKTIDQANQVINRVLMPPVSDNPGRSEMLRAMQAKRLAEIRLDIAA